MNPYEVLGVPEGADEDTIKRAYRELVKKYHPDKYVNNPLSDLAGEKIKEINKAYDILMNKSASSSTGGGYQNTSGGYQSGSQSQPFQQARMLISARRYAEAERILAGLPKTAEWYYLSGVIKLQQGWYDSGIEYIQKAAAMDPSNLEYRATLNNVQNRNTTYRNVTPVQGGGCCDCCSSLMCADCCCECMGGNLIPCLGCR